MHGAGIPVDLRVNAVMHGLRVFDKVELARSKAHEQMADLAHGIGKKHHGNQAKHDCNMNAKCQHTDKHDVAEPLDKVGSASQKNNGTENGDCRLIYKELGELQRRGVPHFEPYLAQTHNLGRCSSRLTRRKKSKHNTRRCNAQKVFEAQI